MKKSVLAILALALSVGATGSALAAKKKVAKPAMTAEELQTYRSGFEEATTAADLEMYIDMYGKNDPEKLVVKAKTKLKDVKAKEEAEARAVEEMQQKSAAEFAQKQEEEKAKKAAEAAKKAAASEPKAEPAK